ncbi:MAG: putative metal-dependent hydrolase [Marmoricola sp.]|jgi:kynurenine formamidase|nr:putative metal-dependent hydrolase [Marmoricola sp.]
MCGPEFVDAETAAKIAASSAAFRQITRSPFGTDDEIGMLNLMTPASMRAVLSRADAGHTLDLSVDYFLGMPSFTAAGQPPYQISMTNTPRGTAVDNSTGFADQNDLVGYSGDAISMYTHCGTHIDTLNHFGYHKKIWNGFDADEYLGARHWMCAGADKQPPIIARGVLLDIAALHGVDVLPESYGIGKKDLSDAARAQNVQLRPGDVVMVRTGQMTLWNDATAYMRNEPGLTREGAEFLARSGAIVVGADNLSLEQIPSTEPGNWLPVHTYLFAEAGVTIMEVVDLEKLSQENLYEFCFIGAGLKLRGATGAPMRPMAMPLLPA